MTLLALRRLYQMIPSRRRPVEPPPPPPPPLTTPEMKRRVNQADKWRDERLERLTSEVENNLRLKRA